MPRPKTRTEARPARFYPALFAANALSPIQTHQREQKEIHMTLSLYIELVYLKLAKD